MTGKYTMPDVIKILPSDNVMGQKHIDQDMEELLDKLEQFLIEMEKGGTNG
jgi:hypothetical protein